MSTRLTLHVRGKGERGIVAASAFLEAARKFMLLVKDVEENVFTIAQARSEGGLIWNVEGLSVGSATMTIAGYPSPETDIPLAANIVTIVTTAVTSGLGILQSSMRRPKYFSNDALSLARSLAAMVGKQVDEVIVSAEDSFVKLESGLIAAADQILQVPHAELGEVVGTLKMVSVAGAKPRCNVYDAVTNLPVRCQFADEMLPVLASALGRRVRVSGLISYTADGYPRLIDEIYDLEVLPPDDKLPTTADLLNHGIDLSVGLTLDEFLARRKKNRDMESNLHEH